MKTATASGPAKSRIFLSPPHMGAVELAFIEEAFRTNFIAPTGPHVDAFEREFAARFGFKHAAAMSSGTAAIHLSLRLLGVQPGDEVVCSSLTFAASANPIIYERARPVFIDSDEATWNMDPALLEDWLADRAKAGRLPRAVIAVDLFGQCADLARIAAACERHGVPMIEDAAEALGASYAGRWAGSFGQTGIFSFNGNKIITTSGGGMLVSDDADLISKARFLATQARDPAQHYQHSQLGFNYRMSNVLAGIGRAQLQLIDERVNARRKIFARYYEELKDLPGVKFMPESPLSRSNRWLTALTIDPAIAGVDSETVRKTLEAENIEGRLVWKPLHLQPVFTGCEMIGGPVSERQFSQGLCLPSGSSMSEDDCHRVVDAFRTAFPNQPRKRRKAAEAATAPTGVPSLWEKLGHTMRENLMAGVRRFLHWSDRRIGRTGLARFCAILLTYTVELGAVFYLSYQMRWDFDVPDSYNNQLLTLIVPIIICKLVLLRSFGQFRSILSYYGLADFGAVVLSMGTVSGMMMSLWYASRVSAAPPRGVVLMDFVLSVAAISAFRLTLRLVRMWSVSGEMRPGLVERQVVIVGASDAGQEYAKNLLQRRGCGLQPVFFVDDDPRKIGHTIHGLAIYGPIEKLVKLASHARVDELVVAQAGVTAQRLREIVSLGRRIGAAIQIIPTFGAASAFGTAIVDRRRPVDIEDLLGREPLNLDWAGIAALLRDRVVMVTGAGGSIGGELCRQILSCHPRRLVLVDQSESAIFEIEQELAVAENAGRIVPLIADVSNENSMRLCFERNGPEIIFHAAGHKHASVLERQPVEAIKNNVVATAGFARLASEFGAERFILVSTDKAVVPTNVMARSMRLAEIFLRAQQHAAGNTTEFAVVRFGTVLGSSGSIIPAIRKQIAKGGPVTIVSSDTTRFFMTIPEAVGLVLQTAALAHQGGVFMLDRGRPVKVIDLARQMIELSGYKPDVDIAIKVTASSSGEEKEGLMLGDEKACVATEHARIFRMKDDFLLENAENWLEALRSAASQGDAEEAVLILGRLTSEAAMEAVI